MCYQNVVGSINLLDAGRRLIGIRFEVVRSGFKASDHVQKSAAGGLDGVLKPLLISIGDLGNLV